MHPPPPTRTLCSLYVYSGLVADLNISQLTTDIWLHIPYKLFMHEMYVDFKNLVCHRFKRKEE